MTLTTLESCAIIEVSFQCLWNPSRGTLKVFELGLEATMMVVPLVRTCWTSSVSDLHSDPERGAAAWSQDPFTVQLRISLTLKVT